MEKEKMLLEKAQWRALNVPQFRAQFFLYVIAL